jgi:putative tryptophan/tyrosine transport system substrate-binding protein
VRRREFIALLGGAAAAWPAAAGAQQTGVPVVGYLDPGTPKPSAQLVSAFREGLAEGGYVEGRNLAVEYRWAEAQYDSLPELAAGLVARKVAVIAAMNGVPTALAAKAATSTIPIVFFVGVDPVAFGLVASLNRPGGNVTGVTGLGTELGPKRLEMLKTLRPAASWFAFVVNPSNAAAMTQSKDLQAAASSLGVRVEVQHAGTERDLETAFATLNQLGAGGVVIGADGFMNSRINQIAALALSYSMPTAYQYRAFAAAGGLMSYGGSITEAYSLVGRYVTRVLKGENPADLPVQQSTKVELIINLKTAKALGLDVPATLLARADEVIE